MQAMFVTMLCLKFHAETYAQLANVLELSTVTTTNDFVAHEVVGV